MRALGIGYSPSCPMPERRLHFRIRREDGSLWATVDEYPGVFATGEDLEELRASLEEGIRFVKAEAGAPLPDVRLLPLTLPDETSASAELVSA